MAGGQGTGQRGQWTIENGVLRQVVFEEKLEGGKEVSQGAGGNSKQGGTRHVGTLRQLGE